MNCLDESNPLTQHDNRDRPQSALSTLPVPSGAPYGYCPQCGAPGIARERCIGGNDRCAKGHDYPSMMAVAE